MKKFTNFSFAGVFILAIVALASCKKEENKVEFQGGTAPVLTSTIASPIVLTDADKNNTAAIFSWTNPNYKFSTGTSSQDVTYTLQLDTAGAAFKTPNETVIPKELGVTLTVAELNKKILAMNLPWGVSKNFMIRVKSSLGNGTVPLYSNVKTFTATAYLDAAVTPPGTAPSYADGKLFLVGDATNGGWNNPVPVPTQEFTKIDATHYTLTVSLIGGKEYLLLPTNGDWGRKYGNACGSNGCNATAGYDFKAQGDNIKAPASSGTYTIAINFVSGKITVQ